MQNPFDVIINRLNEIDEKLSVTNTIPPAQNIEIIDRVELRKRLDITEPTAIRWEKKGRIPSFRIGSSVRYNWPKVVASLESH